MDYGMAWGANHIRMYGCGRRSWQRFQSHLEISGTVVRRGRTLSRARRYMGEAVWERESSMLSDEATIRGIGSWEGGEAQLQIEIVVASVGERKLGRRIDVREDLLSRLGSCLRRRD
jgi:hypothetical protein